MLFVEFVEPSEGVGVVVPVGAPRPPKLGFRTILIAVLLSLVLVRTATVSLVLISLAAAVEPSLLVTTVVPVILYV